MAVNFNAQQYNYAKGLTRQHMAEDMFDIYAETPNLDAALAAQVASTQARRAERELQEKLWKDQNYQSRITNETSLQKVDIGSTQQGNDAVRNLLRGMQEKVYKVKEIGRSNPQEQHKVPQLIAEQEAAINRIMGVATNVSVSLDAYEKAMKIPPGQTGAVSVMTPDATQRVMLGIKDGSTSFVLKGGELYGIKPRSEGGSDVVNLDKLSQEIENGNDFFQTVPDLSESLKGGYDNILKPNGKDNVDYITFEEQRVGSQVATVKYMTTDQRNKAADALVKSNQFKGILDDEERMKVIWSDMMGNDVPWQQVEGGTREEVEAALKKQRNEAAYFLAQKALEDNTAPDGVKMVVSRSKYTAPGSSKGAGPSKPPSLADQRFSAKQAIYEDYITKSDELVNDYNGIAKALTEVNPVDGTYTVVDDQYVIDQMDDDLYDKYAEADDAEKEKILKNAAGKIKVTIGETIIDEDGNAVAGLNSASGIKKALTKVHGISAEDQRIFDTKISERERRVKAEAQKAYDAIEEKPAANKEYFNYEGKRYKNPTYTGDRSGQGGTFDPNAPGTKANPHQGVAKKSDAVEGQYYVNTGMNNNSPDKGKVYQFKNGKYVEVK